MTLLPWHMLLHKNRIVRDNALLCIRATVASIACHYRGAKVTANTLHSEPSKHLLEALSEQEAHSEAFWEHMLRFEKEAVPA